MTNAYIFAALLLHKLGEPITEKNITKVMKVAAVKSGFDPSRVKALVAALEGINIEEAIRVKDSSWPGQVSVTTTLTETAEIKRDKTDEDEPDEIGRGLRDLFGG